MRKEGNYEIIHFVKDNDLKSKDQSPKIFLEHTSQSISCFSLELQKNELFDIVGSQQ